jgi:hypothetical protein
MLIGRRNHGTWAAVDRVPRRPTTKLPRGDGARESCQLAAYGVTSALAGSRELTRVPNVLSVCRRGTQVWRPAKYRAPFERQTKVRCPPKIPPTGQGRPSQSVPLRPATVIVPRWRASRVPSALDRGARLLSDRRCCFWVVVVVTVATDAEDFTLSSLAMSFVELDMLAPEQREHR